MESSMVHVNTDHAGCLRARTSTSGCAMTGAHVLWSWSMAKPRIMLRFGEAELHGVMKAAAAAAAGFGILFLLADLGAMLTQRFRKGCAPVRSWAWRGTLTSKTFGFHRECQEEMC